MQRIPEPELMDGAEQAEAYASADFDASDDAFQLTPAYHRPSAAEEKAARA